MAKAGTILDNPVTGEHYVILQTAQDTKGQLLKFELYIPNGFRVVPHIHPAETETIRVVEGQMTISLNGVEQTLGPGQQVVITPNTRHVWWNSGADKLHFVEELTPAMGWETLFEQIFGLAQDGKTDKNGIPSLFQIALSLNTWKNHVWFVGIPILLQRILFPIFAVIARFQGLKPWYPKYSPDGPVYLNQK